MVSGYAVQFRYPGESALREDAQRAMSVLKKYRRYLREALCLPA